MALYENNKTRREFLTKTGMGAAGIILLPTSAIAKPAQRKRPDALKPELVREFVVAGHSKLERTKEMLEETPGLLNATWDWGGGDFETALGGAGHVGNKDIASYLLQKGARTDIFVAAMMGQLDVVKSLIKAVPEMLHSKGPHNYSLLHHAKKGGEESRHIVEYLTSLGLEK